VGLDLGIVPPRTQQVEDFSTFVGVYKDSNRGEIGRGKTPLPLFKHEVRL
jgi:hypothetical protein